MELHLLETSNMKGWSHTRIPLKRIKEYPSFLVQLTKMPDQENYDTQVLTSRPKP